MPALSDVPFGRPREVRDSVPIESVEGDVAAARPDEVSPNQTDQGDAAAKELVQELKEKVGEGGVASALEELKEVHRQRYADTSTFQYQHLPESARKILSRWDQDNSGAISSTELAAAAEAYDQTKKLAAFEKKLIMFFAVAMVLLLAGVFALAALATELSKEVFGKDGVLANGDGTVLQAASSEFFVSSTGHMMARAPVSNNNGTRQARRLSDDQDSTRIITTARSKVDQLVTANMPAAMLDLMHGLVVWLPPDNPADFNTEEKWRQLRFDVIGAASMPAIGSLCSSYLDIETTKGYLSVVDQAVFFSPTLLQLPAVRSALPGSAAAASEGKYLKLPVNTEVWGKFDKLLSGVSASPCLANDLLIPTPTVLVGLELYHGLRGRRLTKNGMRSSGQHYLHLQGSVIKADGQILAERLLIAPDRTYMIETFPEMGELVSVRDHLTGTTTSFQRRNTEEKLYCVVGTASPVMPSMDFRHIDTRVGPTGPESMWKGSTSSTELFEVGLDLRTGLVREIIVKPPFSNKTFLVSETLQYDTFYSMIKQLGLENAVGCGARSSMATRKASAGIVTVEVFEEANSHGNYEALTLPLSFSSSSSEAAPYCPVDTTCAAYGDDVDAMTVCVEPLTGSPCGQCGMRLSAVGMSGPSVELHSDQHNGLDISLGLERTASALGNGTGLLAGAGWLHDGVMDLSVRLQTETISGNGFAVLLQQRDEADVNMPVALGGQLSPSMTQVRPMLSGQAVSLQAGRLSFASGLNLDILGIRRVALQGQTQGTLMLRQQAAIQIDAGPLGLLDGSLATSALGALEPRPVVSRRLQANAFDTCRVWEPRSDRLMADTAKPEELSTHGWEPNKVPRQLQEVPSADDDDSADIGSATIKRTFRPSRKLQQARTSLGSAELLIQAVQSGTVASACTSQCRQHCDDEMTCTVHACYSTGPWCGLLNGLEDGLGEWAPPAAFAAAMNELAASIEQEKPLHRQMALDAKARFEQLAAASRMDLMSILDPGLTGGHSWKDKYQYAYIDPNQTFQGWSDQKSQQVVIEVSRLVQTELAKFLVGRDGKLPVNQTNMPGLLSSGLSNSDAKSLVGLYLMGVNHSAEAVAVAHRLVPILSYETFTLRVCLACRSLVLESNNLKGTLQFGGGAVSLKMSASSLELTSDMSASALVLREPSASLNLHASPAYPYPIGFGKTDNGAFVFDVGRMSLDTVLDVQILPRYVGIKEGIVKKIVFEGGIKATTFLKWYHESPVQISGHPLIKDVAMDADLFMTDDTSPRTEMILDRINLTMSYNGNKAEKVNMVIDGQAQSGGQLALPLFKVALTEEATPVSLAAVTRLAAAKLGLEDALARRTLSRQLVFDYDLSSDANDVYSRIDAALQGVTIVFRPNALAPLQATAQRLLTVTTGGQFHPHGAVVILDQLDIGLSSASVASATVKQGEAIELRNLLVPGLALDVSLAQFQESLSSNSGLLSAGPLNDMNQRPPAVRETLARHLASRLCLSNSEGINFQGISAKIPLRSDTSLFVELSLHGVRWGTDRQSAFPLFGNASVSFEDVHLRLPASKFLTETSAASALGGDVLLDDRELQLEIVGPKLDLPRLSISGLSLATRTQGATDGFGRRLPGEQTPRLLFEDTGGAYRQLQAAKAASQAVSSYCARGDASKSAGSRCPLLQFKADGKPMLGGSTLFSRRLGKVAFRQLEGKNLYADQNVQVSSVQQATLHVQLSNPMELRFSMDGGQLNFDDTGSSRRLLRRLLRVEQEAGGEHRLLGDLSTHADEAYDEAERAGEGESPNLEEEYPQIGPFEHFAAALVASAPPAAGRRLQTQRQVTLLPATGFEVASTLETDPVSRPGSFHVVFDWENKVRVFGVEAAEEEHEISKMARRLEAAGQGARLRASQVRRLADSQNSSRPLMMTFGVVKEGQTCADMECEAVSTKEECERYARDLSMSSIRRRRRRRRRRRSARRRRRRRRSANGRRRRRSRRRRTARDTSTADQQRAPAGCYWQADGDFTGLYFNANEESEVGYSQTASGGRYSPICKCKADATLCPAPDPNVSVKFENDETNILCTAKKGKPMPKVVGEVHEPTIETLNEKCPDDGNFTNFTNLSDPLQWSTTDFSSLEGKCARAALAGPLASHVEGSDEAFVQAYITAKAIVSKAMTLTSLAIPGLGEMSPSGHFMMNLETEDKVLYFVMTTKVDTEDLQSGPAEDLLKLGGENPTWERVLQPAQTTVKMSVSINATGNMTLSDFYALAGYKDGIPEDILPEGFEIPTSLDLVHAYALIGLTSTGSTIENGPEVDVDDLSGGQVTLGRVGAPYLCFDFEWEKFKGAAIIRPTTDDNGTDPVSFKDGPGLLLEGQLNITTPQGGALNLEEEFKLSTRLSYLHNTSELKVEAFTEKPFRWKLEDMGADLELVARAGYSGDRRNFSLLKTLDLRAKACGFGGKVVNFGEKRLPLQYFAKGEFGGTIGGGLDWSVEAGVSGVQISSWLKKVDLVVKTSRNDAFKIEGNAKLELEFGEVKPKAQLQLNYDSSIGFYGGVNTTAQVFPKSWGLDRASLNISYDPRRSPSFQAFAKQTGTLKVDAIFPGAPEEIEVGAELGTGKPLDLNGSFTITLPPALWSKEVEVKIRINSANGMQIIGNATFDKTIIDLPEVLNEQKVPDLKLDKVIIFGGVPWPGQTEEGEEKTRPGPHLGIWAQGTAAELDEEGRLLQEGDGDGDGDGEEDGKDTLVTGLVVLAKKPCILFQGSSSLVKAIKEAVGMDSEEADPLTFARCKDTKVLEDLQLPELTEAAEIIEKENDNSSDDDSDGDGDSSERRLRELSSLLSAQEKSALISSQTARRHLQEASSKSEEADVNSIVSKAKEFREKMPKNLKEAATALNLPMLVSKESIVGTVLGLLNVDTEKVSLHVAYDDGKVVIDLELNEVEWKPNSGALVSAIFTLSAHVAISKAGLEELTIVGDTEVKIKLDDEGEKILDFNGAVSMGKEGISGSIELRSPTNLRLISKRVALISSEDKPSKLSISIAPTQMSLGITALVALMAKQDIDPAKSGSEVLAQCTSLVRECLAVDLEIAVSVGLPRLVPSIDRFYLKWTGDLSMVNLVTAVTGLDVSDSTRGLLNKFMGVSPIGIIDYNPDGDDGAYVKVAGAAQMLSTTNIMFAVQMNLGKSSLDMSFSVGIGRGCLGFGGDAACTGIMMQQPEDDAEQMKVRWGTLVQRIKDAHSPDAEETVEEWGRKYMPGVLQKPEGLSSSAIFSIGEEGFSLDLRVKAKLSVGFSAALSEVLPTVDAVVLYKEGSFELQFETSVLGIVSKFDFSVFLGGEGADGDAQPPSFKKLDFNVDFSGLYQKLKDTVRKFVGKVAYDFLEFIGAWNVLRLNRFFVSINTEKVRLSAGLTVLGYAINPSTTLEFQPIIQWLSGDFFSTLRKIAEDLWRRFSPNPFASPADSLNGPYLYILDRRQNREQIQAKNQCWYRSIAKACFQKDGNLVVYGLRGPRRPIGSSGTDNTWFRDHYLFFKQESGGRYLEHKGCVGRRRTGNGCEQRRYGGWLPDDYESLVMQADCKVVSRDRRNHPHDDWVPYQCSQEDIDR